MEKGYHDVAEFYKDEEEFIWTDELVAEYGEYYRKAQGSCEFWGNDILAAFKRSKAKPHLGLKPFWLHNEHRLQEINNAIKRYSAAGHTVPQEWINEKQSLDAFVKGRLEESLSSAKVEERKSFMVEGKELTDGDVVWYVRADLGIDCALFFAKTFTPLPTTHFFLTKEAAEQWIAYNQKSISFQQLLEYVDMIQNKATANYKFPVLDMLNHFRPKESAAKQ